MTKNVELHTSTWSKMKNALSSLTGGGGYSSTGYGGYGGYNGYGVTYGFGKQIRDLVDLSERAKQLIAEKDSDGVVSFSYHDEKEQALTLQAKLGKLETYFSNVSKYITDKIDKPFYEAMDKVGASLEALSISTYKTSNTVGYKRTDQITDMYGHSTTIEVTPKEISLADLYQVDNPYKTALEASYEAYKTSDAYQEHKLTASDYLMASHHTRAFQYDSISDQQETIELWRDLALGAGVIVLTIFCPPAGVAAGITLAAVETYSTISGKDWGTGRELSDGERALRGSFALFDLVPGVGYLSKVAKSGSKLAAKEFLQATLKEGFEQGVRNVDNVVKLANKVGDKVMGQVDNFGKQLANVTNKTVVSGAEHLSSGLKAVDSQLSDMAQNFRLNVNLEPQFVSGVTPTSSSQIDTLTSKLDDFVSLNKADMAASSADVSKGFSLNGNTGTGYSTGSGVEFGNAEKLEAHFSRHGSEMKQALNKNNYSIIDYLSDANHVIKEGQFVPEMNGYIKLIGGEGSAKYAFVGLDRATGNITTLHLKSVKELAKKAPSLGLKP
ncbi:pre-toxin TG domain-containing protein [Granulicatella seriolae]|uniref:Type IV secretion protein Rhs n=1 Tax=Granulicatella seriolae TaxID=2967226 RepID=A0ABT1WNV5_9LACT|nr:pre-toxin TG domain-containing protein [Granulicatella seriolae]